MRALASLRRNRRNEIVVVVFQMKYFYARYMFTSVMASMKANTLFSHWCVDHVSSKLMSEECRRLLGSSAAFRQRKWLSKHSVYLNSFVALFPFASSYNWKRLDAVSAGSVDPDKFYKGLSRYYRCWQDRKWTLIANSYLYCEHLQ
jgi:hypothetical protein